VLRVTRYGCRTSLQMDVGHPACPAENPRRRSRSRRRPRCEGPSRVGTGPGDRWQARPGTAAADELLVNVETVAGFYKYAVEKALLGHSPRCMCAAPPGLRVACHRAGAQRAQRPAGHRRSRYGGPSMRLSPCWPERAAGVRSGRGRHRDHERRTRASDTDDHP
jgi:hypothetical protein